MGLAKYYYTSGQKLTKREEIFFGLKPKDEPKTRTKKSIKNMTVDDILKKLL